MVGGDSVHDIRFLLIFLSDLSTEQSVRQLTLLIGHLTDIVEQSGALSLLRVQSELGGHHRAEVSGLAGVLQEVLSVG